METSETIGAIAAALAKAHLEIDNPELDGVNPHFKSRFSTLAAVLNAVRKPLAKQGIALLQSVAIAENRVAVTTSLIHASGEWMRETMSFPMPGNPNVQQAGSTVTYLRRYSALSLCAIVGDPHEDDDGDGDRVERIEQRKPEPRRDTRQPFRPENAKGAAPAPKTEEAAPPAGSGVMDKYPDEWTGEVTILRVTERKGKPAAIHVEGEHGRAWIACSVAEYVNMAKERVDETAVLELHRVGQTLTVMSWRNQPAAKVEQAEIPF